MLLMAFLTLSRHAVEIGGIDVGEMRKWLGVAKNWVGWVNGVGGAAMGWTGRLGGGDPRL